MFLLLSLLFVFRLEAMTPRIITHHNSIWEPGCCFQHDIQGDSIKTPYEATSDCLLDSVAFTHCALIF